MREQQTGEVVLKDTQSDVLEAFLSFMYGKLKKVPDNLLLPMFMLADAHQVRPCTWLHGFVSFSGDL